MQMTRCGAFVLAILAVFVLSGPAASAHGHGGHGGGKTAGKSGGQKGKSSGSGKTIHVKEYKKKDGTVVHEHDRRPPGAGSDRENGTTSEAKSSAPHSGAASSSTAESDGPSTHAVAHARCENCDRDKHGKIVRGKDAKKGFERATGFPNGRPGYIIDHINPLACGGADLPSNMQWQTKAEAKAKDKVELAGCGR
jgi:hypothetical protein